MSRALVYGVQRLGRLLDGGSTQLPGDCVIGCLSISWAMSGWLAGRRRVVALGSDVAEGEEDGDSDSCTWRTRAEFIAVALMGGGCVEE